MENNLKNTYIYQLYLNLKKKENTQGFVHLCKRNTKKIKHKLKRLLTKKGWVEMGRKKRTKASW